jgi:hypothetical protein
MKSLESAEIMNAVAKCSLGKSHKNTIPNTGNSGPYDFPFIKVKERR